jgi:TRAP-type mannitol/chloroaromatic compound transport system permease small subunit
MMFLHTLIRIIDSYTEFTGKWLAWLCLAMTLVTCIVVLGRYGLGLGSVALQESITYMHASLFMLCAAFTLKRGGHVRVDIFYRNFSSRTRAWINSVGAIVFLLPFCVFVLGISWQFVTESWAIREGSQESGGIHAVYLLKTLIPLMAFNLLAQGVAETLRNTLRLVEGEN